jgi:hypothetical protein
MSQPQTNLKDQLTKAAGRHTYQGQVKALADKHLSQLRAARTEGVMALTISNMPAIIDTLLQQVDFDASARYLQSLSPAALQDMLKTMKQGSSDNNDGSMEQALLLKGMLGSLSEGDHVKISSAIENILPPLMQQAVLDSRGGKTLTEEIREMQTIAASLTPDDIAAAMAQNNEDTNTANLAKSLHDLFQQATPRRLEHVFDCVFNNFETDQIGYLLQSAWDVAEDILQAADKGDFLKPANPQKLREFGETVQYALTLLEEGIIEAGFKMPEKLGVEISQVFNNHAFLKKAHALKEAHHAVNGTSRKIQTMPTLKLKKAATP